VHMTRF
jgi:hypothetical protein